MSSSLRVVVIWGALVALAAASLLLSHVVHGRAGMALSLGIGAAKAALIAWFYMHLAQEGTSIRVAVAAGLGLFLLLFGLSLADVSTQPPVSPQLAPALSRPASLPP